MVRRRGRCGVRRRGRSEVGQESIWHPLRGGARAPRLRMIVAVTGIRTMPSGNVMQGPASLARRCTRARAEAQETSSCARVGRLWGVARFRMSTMGEVVHGRPAVRSAEFLSFPDRARSSGLDASPLSSSAFSRATDARGPGAIRRIAPRPGESAPWQNTEPTRTEGRPRSAVARGKIRRIELWAGHGRLALHRPWL